MDRIESTLKPDDREARLPKWVRDDLRILRMRLREAHEQLTAGPEDSRASADPYSDHPRPLGTRPHVAFEVEDDASRHYISVQLRRGEQKLHVYGTRSVVIRPESGNTFTVELEQRNR